MLFAAMGVSLGTLAGVATAFVSVPTASAAAVDTNSGGNVQTAALATPTENARAGSSSNNDSVVAQPVAEDSTVHRAIKVEQVPAVERARAKTPSVDKTETPATAPTESHPARHLAHPVTRPLRTEVATDPEVAPATIEMEADQPVLVIEAKSSNIYSEGDVTVEDYDAAQGTIETTDGRTFELGETVSMGNTVAWDQYRSNVHYRCEQGGSCVLQRDGVVSVNAKQI
jgi:hypothetical protein